MILAFHQCRKPLLPPRRTASLDFFPPSFRRPYPPRPARSKKLRIRHPPAAAPSTVTPVSFNSARRLFANERSNAFDAAYTASRRRHHLAGNRRRNQDPPPTPSPPYASPHTSPGAPYLPRSSAPAEPPRPDPSPQTARHTPMPALIAIASTGLPTTSTSLQNRFTSSYTERSQEIAFTCHAHRQKIRLRLAQTLRLARNHQVKSVLRKQPSPGCTQFHSRHPSPPPADSPSHISPAAHHAPPPSSDAVHPPRKHRPRAARLLPFERQSHPIKPSAHPLKCHRSHPASLAERHPKAQQRRPRRPVPLAHRLAWTPHRPPTPPAPPGSCTAAAPPHASVPPAPRRC